MTQQAHDFSEKHTHFSQHDTPDQQEEPTIQPWQRQKGEPGLWWRRFRIYRDLGAKRSLQAAAAKEREKIQVLHGTKDEKKAEGKTQRVNVSAQLQEVPKQKPAQAPGSWKIASINWHWVERAKAYDEHMIEEIVNAQLEILEDGPALAFNRIQSLIKIYDSLAEQYGKFSGSYHDMIALAGRLQSLLRDIREEMSQYDKEFTSAVLSMHVTRFYENLDDGLEASVNAELKRRKKNPLK